MKNNNKRYLYLFYALVAYIVLQFVWWEVLLVRQKRQIVEEQRRIAALSIADPSAQEQKLQGLEADARRHVYMLVGEGTVFLIILSFGILKVYQSFRKERELQQQQRNFLLSITHELKSPLASVRLQLETLMRKEWPRDKQEMLIRAALEDNQRLHQLVENVLISARLDSAGTGLNMQRMNVSDLCTEVYQRYFMSFPQVSCEVSPNVFLLADALAFPSIVINLVENALKYGHGKVELRLGLDKNQAVLSVSDQGKGIPDGEKQKVFEKFFRSGDEQTRTHKGTGLGLFIVQRLVHQHGGTIELRDVKPSGACFEIRFPLHQETVK